MITFENNFERDFWIRRFEYWESRDKFTLRSPESYADDCVLAFRDRKPTVTSSEPLQVGDENIQNCPYNAPYGMQYGVDAGKSIACNTCHIYQHCKDAKDYKNIKPV